MCVFSGDWGCSGRNLVVITKNNGNVGCLFIVLLNSYSFFFLWLYIRFMEVPGLGVKLELQLRPTPQPWQHLIQATSVTYSKVCKSLTN